MDDLFVGWDVGAWNCDRNRRSRDTLSALAIRDRVPKVVGRPWRGNLRAILNSFDGLDLVHQLLGLVAVEPPAPFRITIAVDTPLAWPMRTIRLLTEGTLAHVPAEADHNPYLFRLQELALFADGCRPLSMVRDMIGSQSTKGIHFLRRAGLHSAEIGVWTDPSLTVEVIETYPAAAVRDTEVHQLTAKLFAEVLGEEERLRGATWQDDVRDAITSALVAWLYRSHPARLTHPGARCVDGEGWIWLPVGATASTS